MIGQKVVHMCMLTWVAHTHLISMFVCIYVNIAKAQMYKYVSVDVTQVCMYQYTTHLYVHIYTNIYIWEENKS